MQSGVVIPKVWRSEPGLFIWFVVSLILSVYLSYLLPGSIISGELFRIGSTIIVLSLPLFWFVPFFVLSLALFRIYDVKYCIDSEGIETRVGVIGMRQRIVRVRYEDIRSIEKKQTWIQRILDVGNIEVGTSATAGVEIILAGIGSPGEVQEVIRNERDRRQKIAAHHSAHASRTTGAAEAFIDGRAGSGH